MKIMVTTYPFGTPNETPKLLLDKYDVHYNEVGREYTEAEIEKLLTEHQPNIVIAGTEKYNNILNQFDCIKMISRVGIGLDSIPLDLCHKKGITVAYTPDAPSNAVAELTICQMLNMLRHVQKTDEDIRNGKWIRRIGKEIRDCNVGVIGCGRVGKLVIEKLQGLKPRRIFVNDIDEEKMNLPRCEPDYKESILSMCDIVTIHIPYTDENKNYIAGSDFDNLRSDVCLINTSRGGIINEHDLCGFLLTNIMARAAIDVYNDEPYTGKLIDLPNTFLTPHLGSCSTKSRFGMEVGAVENAINFIEKKHIQHRVI